MTRVRGYNWISKTADLSKDANPSWVRGYVSCSIFRAPWGDLPIRDCCKSPIILRIRAGPTLIKVCVEQKSGRLRRGPEGGHLHHPRASGRGRARGVVAARGGGNLVLGYICVWIGYRS